ncbi:MAG: BrnT family toxin [Brachymonas sp.]|uniref:BrnT family toxin n=1 Tax=unclassified Brachymonas TaxID=2621329 RepID=UPI0035B05AFC
MQRYFEWDDHKADLNFRKHGIRFEDAARVFDDPLALSVQDRIEHGEQRWQTLGMVGGCVVLLVAHTLQLEDEGAEIIRIISARRADRHERHHYEQS